MSAKDMNAIDLYVAARIKKARLDAGKSQTALADECGVTFQQLQKYENGTNRISAGRLATLAAALDIQVTWFFTGAPRAKLAA